MTIAISVGGGVAAPNYGTLKTLVAEYLDRSDLVDMIPVFIEFAHRKFNRDLITPDRENVLDTVITGDFTLPDDFYQLRELYIPGTPNRPLMQVTPFELHDLRTAPGRPKLFAIANGQVMLAPQPDSSMTLRMLYIKAIPLLSEADPVNWLLTKHPDLYLYASLAEAYGFLKDFDKAQLWLAQAQAMMGEILAAGNRYRYSAAPAAMRPGNWA